ncbi:MAG: multiheme c-type cytochrome [Gammaproteobacteria bacterium]|nr:multiheme c-type cytochrome [Gammaproteobacteria bacterium]
MTSRSNPTGNKSNRYRFIFDLAQILVFTSLIPALAQDTTSPGTEASAFIGSNQCASCHQAQFVDWKSSDHFRAMVVADAGSVKGDFENINVVFHDIESRFFKRDNQYFVTTTNGKNEQETFQIKYTFGHYPLQQYLIETDNGHIQAFNIAWDSRSKEQGGQRWFHLRDNEEIDTEHPFFWTGHFQNWNSRCADCHSTNVSKNYNFDENAYQTQWSEINVGCEACHGPGREHYELVNTNRYSQSKTGFIALLPETGTWVLSAGADIAEAPGHDIQASQSSTLNTCGGCHSRRASLGRTEHGKSYHDQFQLQTLRDDLYYADGQIQDEVFVFGSFMQSKMHQKGVTCANCHNSHSGKVLIEGNGLCLQCHRPETFNTTAHHGHNTAKPGGQCVACHMPETTYMKVDPRRDHRFGIPRPDLSLELGVPNACVKCHRGKTDRWALAELNKKHGVEAAQNTASPSSKPARNDAWIIANYRSRKLDPLVTRQIETVINQPGLNSIRHATLLSQLSSMPSRVSAELAAKGLTHDDPLVRQAAVAALQGMPPQVIVNLLSSRLDDPSRVVRSEMGLLLASIIDRVPMEHQIKANRLIDEYRSTLEYGLDSPANLSNLASLNLYLGEPASVEALYLQALEIEPAYVPAMVNLADWYRSQAKEAEAGAMLARSVAIAPDSAMAQHALGLHLVRLRKYGEALFHLQLAAEMDQSQPRYHYVYAIALESQGQLANSIQALTKAVERWPNQFDLLFTLVSYMEKQGRLSEAGGYISQLTRIAPASAQVKDLMLRFRQLNG